MVRIGISANCVTTLFKQLKLDPTRKSYSHGPTISQIHSQYQDVEKLLANYRPDQMNDPKEVERLLKEKKITEHMSRIFIKDINARNEATKSAVYWRRIFWYFGVPLTILCGINTYFIEKEHFDHLEEHPIEHIPYSHMRIRTKNFFWGDGDHTVFHNPKVNGP